MAYGGLLGVRAALLPAAGSPCRARRGQPRGVVGAGDSLGPRASVPPDRSSSKTSLHERRAFRDQTDGAGARALAKRYKQFLGTEGTAVGGPPPRERTEGGEHGGKAQVVSGHVLAICELLVRYYQALAAEDENALDRCLVISPKTAAGKDILAIVAARRKQQGDAFNMGRIRFDDKAQIQIAPLNDTDYDVVCTGLLKSQRRGDEAIGHRGMDRFLVRRAEGEYRILIERREGDQP